MRSAAALLATLIMAPAVSGAAARIETVVVTADKISPQALKIYNATKTRLTRAGVAFVAAEARAIHDGATPPEAALDDAAANCARAFDDCGVDDEKRLAVVVLDDAYLIWGPPFSDMFKGVPAAELDAASRKLTVFASRGDMERSSRVLIDLLPPDRKAALERQRKRDRHVRATLKTLLKSMGNG